MNELDVTLTGVSSVTFWPERAGAHLGAFTLKVTSSGPATITLAGTFGTRIVSVPYGTSTTLVTL